MHKAGAQHCGIIVAGVLVAAIKQRRLGAAGRQQEPAMKSLPCIYRYDFGWTMLPIDNLCFNHRFQVPMSWRKQCAFA